MIDPAVKGTTGLLESVLKHGYVHIKASGVNDDPHGRLQYLGQLSNALSSHHLVLRSIPASPSLPSSLRQIGMKSLSRK